MNKSRTKRKSSTHPFVRKIKASMNELSWLDQHESEDSSPIYTATWSPPITISQIHSKSSFPRNHRKWFSQSAISNPAHLQIHAFEEQVNESPPSQVASNWVNEKHENPILQDEPIPHQHEKQQVDSERIYPSEENVFAQYGEISYEMLPEESSSEVIIRFTHAFSNENYALVVSNQQPEMYSTVKTKWRQAALVSITKWKPSSYVSGSLNWIACGKRQG